MKLQVTTKQGKNFIVDDDDMELWIELEDMLDLTFIEAQEKIQRQSMKVLSTLMFIGARKGGHTELKTRKAWIEHEFESFDVVVDEGPKDTDKEASNAT
jgi:actin-related protein